MSDYIRSIIIDEVEANGKIPHLFFVFF